MIRLLGFVLLRQVIYHPRPLITVIDKGTTGLARGIRRVFLIWLHRPRVADAAETIESQGGLFRAIDNFITGEPTSLDIWTKRAFTISVLIAISLTKQYFASRTTPTTPTAPAVVPEPVELPPGKVSTPLDGIVITTRDGTILFTLTPLIISLGCTLAAIIIVFTMYQRGRQTSTVNLPNSTPNGNGSKRDLVDNVDNVDNDNGSTPPKR